MRVLVTGASGFLGRHVVDRLLKGGHSVRAMIRPAAPNPNWKGDVEVFRADLRTHDSLVSAFDGMDSLIHLAAATSGGEDLQFAATVVGTERLLDAMSRSSVTRLVHVSSLVVYDWSRARDTMDEDTPLLDNMYDMGPYSIAKIWQERLVKRVAKANSWQLTVMRPGFIWGPQHEEIAGMGRRFGRTCIMFGPLVRLPLCHVVNCADCIVLALEKPGAIGESFNVVDGDDIRVLRYVREYARRTGKVKFLIPVPYRLGLGLAQLAWLTGQLFFGKKAKLPSLLVPRRYEAQFKPIRFSNRKMRELLSWSPHSDFDHCLQLTYGSPLSEETTGRKAPVPK
jgi:nucleoside-diphosphate-sugar epimerase